MNLHCRWRLSWPLAYDISLLHFFFLVFNHAFFATKTVFQHAEWGVGISACAQPYGMLLGDGECSLQPQNLMAKCAENPFSGTNILTTKA